MAGSKLCTTFGPDGGRRSGDVVRNVMERHQRRTLTQCARQNKASNGNIRGLGRDMTRYNVVP